MADAAAKNEDIGCSGGIYREARDAGGVLLTSMIVVDVITVLSIALNCKNCPL
jgi:hypothetical protein